MTARVLWTALLALQCSAAAWGEETQIKVGVSRSGEMFTVDATINVPVTQKTAWDVLTDFDHMAAMLSSLTLSKVLSREGDNLVVRQEGVAKYGLLSFSFVTERKVHLEAMTRVQSWNLSGTVKRMDSDMRLGPASQGGGVLITYHAEIVPDSVLARVFGASALQRQVEDQFRAMAAEMQKRENQTPATASQARRAHD